MINCDVIVGKMRYILLHCSMCCSPSPHPTTEVVCECGHAVYRPIFSPLPSFTLLPPPSSRQHLAASKTLYRLWWRWTKRGRPRSIASRDISGGSKNGAAIDDGNDNGTDNGTDNGNDNDGDTSWWSSADCYECQQPRLRFVGLALAIDANPIDASPIDTHTTDTRSNGYAKR